MLCGRWLKCICKHQRLNEFKTIKWIIPLLHLSDEQKIGLLKRVETNCATAVPFRSWDFPEKLFLAALANVGTTTSQMWNCFSICNIILILEIWILISNKIAMLSHMETFTRVRYYLINSQTILLTVCAAFRGAIEI